MDRFRKCEKVAEVWPTFLYGVLVVNIGGSKVSGREASPVAISRDGEMERWTEGLGVMEGCWTAGRFVVQGIGR